GLRQRLRLQHARFQCVREPGAKDVAVDAPLREHIRPALARLARRAARFAAGGLACALAALPALGQAADLPERVVTLAPHITEMVFAAGAGHTLAGTVVSSNYPEAARALPKVGDGAASINAEALIGLKPDLVLAWHNSGAARSEEHTSELQSRENLVCRLLLEKKN